MDNQIVKINKLAGIYDTELCSQVGEGIKKKMMVRTIIDDGGNVSVKIVVRDTNGSTVSFYAINFINDALAFYNSIKPQ